MCEQDTAQNVRQPAWLRPLPPYNPHRSCPKCGGAFVTSKHVRLMVSGDAIERRCDRCAYRWYEAPRDANEAASNV